MNIQYCHFRINNQHYLLATTDIEGIFAGQTDSDYILYRKKFIQVANVAELVGVEYAQTPQHIIVIQLSGNVTSYGLLVEEVSHVERG